MISHSRVVHLSAIAASTLLMLTSCGGQSASIASQPVTAQTTALATSYPAQKLNQAELALMESELGASEEILTDHSFALDISELGGDVAFVASKARREGEPNRLNLRFRLPDGEYQPLVPTNQDTFFWNFWELKAVAFEDVNGDGLGPDIITIAEYMTGAGPDAAKPFPVAAVYFKDSRGFFTTDERVDEVLVDRNVATIGEVLSLFGR